MSSGHGGCGRGCVCKNVCGSEGKAEPKKPGRGCGHEKAGGLSPFGGGGGRSDSLNPTPPAHFTSSQGYKVLLNRWMGESFENDTQCSLCGNLGHVVELPGGWMQPPAQICQPCLHKMVTAIYEGILSLIPKEGK